MAELGSTKIYGDLEVTGNVYGINVFKTISVAGQSDVVADSGIDTLTLVAGTNITLTTNATNDAITIASTGSSGGAGLTWNLTSANLTAVKNNGYFVDTTAGVKTITLPASPVIGDQVGVADYTGTFGTNPCTINNNGNKIMGVLDTFSCNYNNMTVVFVYADATEGWRLVYMVAGAGNPSTSSSITWNNVSVNTAAIAYNGYFVNTTAGQITLTLPASPTVGNVIDVDDYAGKFGTNNCIIARNGNKIMGLAEDFVCNINNFGVRLVYADSTRGWLITNTALGAGSGSSTPWSVITANTTAVVSNGYFVNTTAGTLTLTLPVTAAVGNRIDVVDYTGTFGTYNCTIARNGSLIMGIAEDFTCDVNNMGISLVYSGATEGWVISATAGGPGSNVYGIVWSIQTASNYAVTTTNTGIFVGTGCTTITLPTAPTVGYVVGINDIKGTFSTTNVTVARNGKLIQGLAEDLILNVKSQTIILTFAGNTDGWRILYALPVGGVTRPFDILHVRDEKAQGTAGGGSTTGIQTRVLQTLKLNEIAGASLNGSNQITLPAGTYEVHITAPIFISASAVGTSKLRLYNVTDSVYVLEGVVNATYAGICSLDGILVLAAQKVIEIRQYTSTTVATNGLGYAASQGLEVYTDAIFKRRTS